MSLTLPGTLPGLLRRCSPVFFGTIPAVVVIGPEQGEPDDETCYIARSDGKTDWGLPRSLALDLEDATGRAHAAWWLAERLRPDVKELMSASVTYGHPDIGAGGYGLAVTCRNDGPLWRRVDVPALDGLDPHNPRLLSDGSRWVDAEALRLACLHVGGVA